MLCSVCCSLRRAEHPRFTWQPFYEDVVTHERGGFGGRGEEGNEEVKRKLPSLAADGSRGHPFPVSVVLGKPPSPEKGEGKAALPGILVRVQLSHKMAVPLCRIADRHTALHCVYSKNSRKLLVGSSKAILCSLGTAIGCARLVTGGRRRRARRQSCACARWLRAPRRRSHACPGLCRAGLGWTGSVALQRAAAAAFPPFLSSGGRGLLFYFLFLIVQAILRSK